MHCCSESLGDSMSNAARLSELCNYMFALSTHVLISQHSEKRYVVINDAPNTLHPKYSHCRSFIILSNIHWVQAECPWSGDMSGQWFIVHVTQPCVMSVRDPESCSDGLNKMFPNSYLPIQPRISQFLCKLDSIFKIKNIAAMKRRCCPT